MTTSKLIALGLLIACQPAIARVQLTSSIEVDCQETTQTIFTEIQLDTNESAVIYNTNGMRIETKVVSEQEDLATVEYAVFFANAAGDFELVSAPVLCVALGDTGTIALGEQSPEGEQVDSLRITLNANKVQ